MSNKVRGGGGGDGEVSDGGKNNTRKTGYFLVFNQNNDREGTRADIIRLKNCWENFDFIVVIFDDPTNDKILESIREYSIEISEHHKMFVVCILAHGNEIGVRDLRGEILPTVDIKNTIKNIQSLKAIPKLLLIQACRGSKKQSCLFKTDSVKEDDNNIIDNFLLYRSTVLPYVAFRLTTGTPFIQILCEYVEKYYKEYHLTDIFILVNHAVHDHLSNFERWQIPELTGLLKEHFYLPEPKQINLNGNSFNLNL